MKRERGGRGGRERERGERGGRGGRERERGERGGRGGRERERGGRGGRERESKVRGHYYSLILNHITITQLIITGIIPPTCCTPAAGITTDQANYLQV